MKHHINGAPVTKAQESLATFLWEELFIPDGDHIAMFSFMADLRMKIFTIVTTDANW